MIGSALGLSDHQLVLLVEPGPPGEGSVGSVMDVIRFNRLDWGTRRDPFRRRRFAMLPASARNRRAIDRRGRAGSPW